MKSLALVSIALILVALTAFAADHAMPPAEGSAAPAFTLPSQEGAQVSLDQFKGKWVVLYFYPKDFTQGCTIEAHNFQRDIDKYTQMNAAIVGVSVDNVDSHKSFCTKEGLNFDDFKNNIRNKLLTQEVIRREVGSHINIGHDETQKYYEEHKKEFVKPEQVALRAIEISTDAKKDTEVPDLKKKADDLLRRIKDGEDFATLAKRFSDGSTAQQGGFLGVYKRGELSKQLEDQVFAMKKNQLTDVIETKQGYLILQVLERYEEGEQPFEKVENEIMDHLYSERMEPALREYLKTLREQSYVVVKPGYQDMAGGGNSEIQEVSATPEASKTKKAHKKYLLFGKRNG